MLKRVISNNVLLPELVKMLEEGLEVTLQSKGNSMLPFIIGGRDSVILQSPPENLQIGDIVLAQINKKTYVIHRIIACDEKQITLMGDGNWYGKEICYPEDILGIVVKIVKNERYIDCRLPAERKKFKIWRKLLPVRRYLLAVYRRIMDI